MNGCCDSCGAVLSGPLLDGLCLRCVAGTLFPVERATGERRFGDYELLRELGRGGMGVVYLARQITLDRLVALKVLAGAEHAAPDAKARFQREAREAARLRHPHIVAIHNVGEHEGAFFYSMDLIEGDDLEARFATRSPPPRDAAMLILRAARAVQYAHDTGVLHRDIKPGNILIDDAGEPFLTDFGLATAVDGGGRLTRPGEMLGSPAYASPEQLQGTESVASDVYSLGAVLYFLLTRRPPFVAAQLPELLAAVQRGDPVPPRRLDPSLPRDMETIALRALAREPSGRYATAGELADDLERWLEGRPIVARPVSSLERAWRWSGRNPALAGVGAMLVAALLTGGAAVTWQWQRAESAAAHTVAQLYASDLRIASDALLAGDLGAARRALERCPLEHRDAAWGVLWPQAQGDAELVAIGAPWTVNDLALSPDRRFVAAAVEDDVVRLWNLGTGEEVRTFPGTETSWWVQFAPEGRDLFTGDTSIKQWSLADGALVREFPGRTGVLSPDGTVLYSCDGQRFVFYDTAGTVTAWRVADGEKLFEIPIAARLLALSADGTRLAVSDAATFVAVYDARDGRRLIEPWPAGERVWELGFSPDGRLLVASGWFRNVRVWDLADVTQPPRHLEHPLNTWEAVFSPDGSALAVGCSDQAVHVWDTATWSKRRVLSGHENEVWSVAWRDNDRLLAAGRDPRVMQWSAAGPAPRPVLRHDDVSMNLAWLPGGRLATACLDADGVMGAVITRLPARQVEARFPGEIPITYDRETRRLWLWAEAAHELRARNVDALEDFVAVPWVREPGDVIEGTPHVVVSAGISWAALRGGALEFRRLNDGHRLDRFEDIFITRRFQLGVSSPDGRWFVWTRSLKTPFILDRATGRSVALEGHHYDVAVIVFTPEGDTFITGGHDGLIYEWTTAAPHHRRELARHRTSVGQIGFSADGRVLVSQEPDVGVRFWNRATEREVAFLPEAVTGAGEWGEFSLEGDWYAQRRADGEVRVWPVADAGGRAP
ncbi:MAG TPA: serine/threonine-protein kinase [Opitutaceae bacterium]|nr:serine/threonine-protein kinase [Opitutaceae bacterium]